MRRRHAGFWLGLCIAVLRPILMALTRRDWRGGEHLPAEGGFILAANHISVVDPLLVGHYLVDHGRLPRFMAKSELFSMPVLGRILAGAGQIPVYRRTPDASLALRDAVAALQRGECVIIYPEGTTTRDPELWPMQAKTGVARLAMLTGAQVVPLAQWGAQRIHRRGGRFRLLPRHTIQMTLLPPVDLSDLAGRDPSVETLRAATDRIMVGITTAVAGLRGEPAPDRPPLRFPARDAGPSSGSSAELSAGPSPEPPASEQPGPGPAQ